jgi:hypothetical protein
MKACEGPSYFSTVAPDTEEEIPMKIQSARIHAVIAAFVLAGVVGSTPAFAQNSQQSKMSTCNAQAGDKKGDDRKAFMKDCLSAKPAAAAPMTQQQKMTACNQQAAGKKGDDRKAFMKTCLSNKAG